MLNIKSKLPEGLNYSLLYYSGKSCYVLARFSLEATFQEFFVPGFLLMQQALENLIKAFLKKENINWKSSEGKYGKKGHEFKGLLELGKEISTFDRILKRPELISLLEELEQGYNNQRYGESGHYIENHEKMMDLFDEIIYILVSEFALNAEKNTERRVRLESLPVPAYIEKTFKRKLKQPFTFMEVLPLDFPNISF